MTENNSNIPPEGSVPPASPLDYQTPPEALPPETNPDARLWGMLCHLTALCVLLSIPFGNIIGPLVVWLIKKNQYPFVDDQGKESLNFQIVATMLVVLCVPLFFCALIGVALAAVVGIVDIVFTIIACVKANQGIPYRYPLPFRLIK